LEEPPPFWNEIGIEDHLHQVILDNDTTAQLNEDWLTPPELEERSRHKAREARLRSLVEPFVSPSIPGITSTTSLVQVFAKARRQPVEPVQK
jgi:hypothetical protein